MTHGQHFGPDHGTAAARKGTYGRRDEVACSARFRARARLQFDADDFADMGGIESDDGTLLSLMRHSARRASRSPRPIGRPLVTAPLMRPVTRGDLEEILLRRRDRYCLELLQAGDYRDYLVIPGPATQRSEREPHSWSLMTARPTGRG